MIESIPKLADLKLLKEMSKVIIVPMLIAAVIIQSGLTLNIGFTIISVNADDSFTEQCINFFAIFIIKGSLTAMAAVIVHSLLLYVHIFLDNFVLHALSTFFLAFGFIGLLSGDEVLFINQLNKMWFYTSFVYGFYFIATMADAETNT
ncbi:MAG: hypothetical protein COA54_15470 [Thiotrichaceae bacterium]|nr:MAG: hypothetical protein COA54_15470 [Thiotrichaceae bacterium]